MHSSFIIEQVFLGGYNVSKRGGGEGPPPPVYAYGHPINMFNERIIVLDCVKSNSKVHADADMLQA